MPSARLTRCRRLSCPQAKSWPWISDLWVHKPSNMISRYAICLSGALVCVTSLGYYVAVKAERARRPRVTRLSLVCSLVAGAGLMGVGACNEHETLSLHVACASLFFGGLATWMILDLLSSVPLWNGPSRAAAVIAASMCIGAKLAQLSCLVREHCVTVSAGPELLEWVAALSGVAYFVIANLSAPETTLVLYSLDTTRSSEAKLAALTAA